MFIVFKVGDWSGVGGSPMLRIATDGVEAVKRREQLGLPPSPQGRVAFSVLDGEVTDRRAAESWNEGLNFSADLPLVINRQEGSSDGNELQDMIAAGLLAFSGPVKSPAGVGRSDDTVGISLRLTCSAFELVCWRKAWAAEQRARKAERRAEEAEKALEQLSAGADVAE